MSRNILSVKLRYTKISTGKLWSDRKNATMSRVFTEKQLNIKISKELTDINHMKTSP